MNKVTLEYEDKGKQCVFTANFKNCNLKREADRVECFGGKNNVKYCEFVTNENLILKLDGINNIFVTYPTKKEDLEVEYVVVPEKPKKKKRKKRKKRKFDNGRKTN